MAMSQITESNRLKYIVIYAIGAEDEPIGWCEFSDEEAAKDWIKLNEFQDKDYFLILGREVT